jgi:L-lactate dehydrogenase complex protein LldG
MNARDEILTRLKEQSREVSLPPPWRSRRQFEDLAERFTQALTAVKGEVWRVDNLEAALEQVDRLLHEIEAETAVANLQPPLDVIDLSGRWPGVTWQVSGELEGDDRDAQRAFAASADIGLSGVDAALAETGTVVVSSGPGRSRLTTLLPPVHLALAPNSSLTIDIFTWAAARGEDLPAAITLISGPSKTADIEQTMAIGVHGPKRFIVVLYDD